MSLPVPATPHSIARAALSPLAVAATVAGMGIALWASAGLFGIVLLAVLAWLLGTGATMAVRGRLQTPISRIDPFGVSEPWRHFVRDALAACNRFDDAIKAARPGPIRDRLTEVRRSVNAGVQECWEVAQQAHNVSQARNQLDAPTLRRRHDRLNDDDNVAAAEAIQSQLDSADRLDRVISATKERLEILEARLTEAVTSAIEVSALARQDDDLTGLGSSVDQVVDDLEALRRALAETNGGPTGLANS